VNCPQGHFFGARSPKKRRILSHGIFVMLVVFFLAGERITWINCLTGFGLRAWLLLYALPSWFTVARAPAAE
jgi:hypothetical protein